jgi:hypothetical protein
MIKLDFKEYLMTVEQGNSTGSVHGQAGRHPWRKAMPSKSFPAPKNPFPKLVATAKVDRPAAFLHPDDFRLDMDNDELQFKPSRFELSPLKPPNPLLPKKTAKIPK